MRAQLVMTIVVEAFDGCIFDRAVHPLDLPIGPWMVRLGEAVLDVVCLADHVEAHLARPGGVAIARLLGELDAIIGQDRVDTVGHGFQQVIEELPCGSPVGLVDQPGDCELAGSVDGDEQVQLAFGRLHLRDVHVEEANGISLEALPFGLVAIDVGQT